MGKLNIKDINYIISEASKILLSEITIQDAYDRFYKDIPEERYKAILSTLQGSDNNVLQANTKWALSLYKKNPEQFFEDMYKLRNEEHTGYLDIFDRLKEIKKISGGDADLNHYKSIAQLGAFVSQFDDSQIWGDANYRKKHNMTNTVKSAADDAEFPFEDEYWKVVIPNSYEASVYWGDGTEWCTAYKDSRKYYDQYSEEGELYIIISKIDGSKCQFHFESDSFMNQYDEDIEKPVLEQFGHNEGLVEYFKKTIPPALFLNSCYINIGENLDINLYACHKDGGYYLMNENGEILSDKLSYISDFNCYGIAKCGVPSGQNLITTDGTFLFKEHISRIDSMYFDKIVYYKNNECGLVRYNEETKTLETLLEPIYDSIVLSTYENFYYVVRNGKANIVDAKTNKETIENSEFFKIYPSDNLKTTKAQCFNGKWVIIDFNGNILSDYYDKINSSFVAKGKVSYIVINGNAIHAKYNALDDYGNLVYSEWLDYLNTYAWIGEDAVLKVQYTHLNGKPVAAFSNGTIKPRNTGNVNEMTINDVKYIVHESARQILQEITVKDAQVSYYNDIPEQDFNAIVQASQGNNNILLPTTKWLLSMYKRNLVNKQNIMDYLPELRKKDKRGYLDIWDRAILRGVYEGENANLNTYRSFMDWIMNMETLDTSKLFKRTKGEWSKAVKDAKNDIEIVYEDKGWIIIRPLSMEASCYWGNGAEWCTATRDEDKNYFQRYNDNGPLYINIDKITKEKYQFSLAQQEFKNSENEDIETPFLKTIGASKGMIDFYKEQCKNDYNVLFDMLYNHLDAHDMVYIEGLDCSYATVVRENPDTGENEWNFYNPFDRIMSYEWFEWAEEPTSPLGICRVKLKNGRYDLYDLSQQKRLIPNGLFYIEEFNVIDELDIAYSIARNNHKMGLIVYVISTNQIYPPHAWYDHIEVLDDNSLCPFKVKSGKSQALMNFDGEIIGDYYDTIYDFDEDGLAMVIQDNMINYINENGDLVSDEWEPLNNE